MHHIRPYRLFTLLDAPISDRVANVVIPSRRAQGGLNLLETFLLITAVKVVAATRIFEFGTFLGTTTLHIALNTPDDARIFTLDLDQDSALGLRQDESDAPLTGMHLSAASRLDFANSNARGKIETFSGDSREFDCSRWAGTIDFVFIDGGHDVSTATADTSTAFRMTRKDTSSCILWHDYQNPAYIGLTDYLDQLSHQVEMFHIEDTMLCVCFQGPHEPIRRHLLGR